MNNDNAAENFEIDTTEDAAEVREVPAETMAELAALYTPVQDSYQGRVLADEKADKHPETDVWPSSDGTTWRTRDAGLGYPDRATAELFQRRVKDAVSKRAASRVRRAVNLTW